MIVIHDQTLKKSLYQWIMEQRRNRNKLSAERIELLDASGFLWENSIMVGKSVTWEKRFEEWKEYCQKHNTPHVHFSLSRASLKTNLWGAIGEAKVDEGMNQGVVNKFGNDRA